VRGTSAAIEATDEYRGEKGGIGAAAVVVGLSPYRAAKEAQIRDDMIRVAHRAGASLRQLAEVSGLDGKTLTSIVGATSRSSDEEPTRSSGVAAPGRAG